jgi:hypothetical protein
VVAGALGTETPPLDLGRSCRLHARGGRGDEEEVVSAGWERKTDSGEGLIADKDRGDKAGGAVGGGGCSGDLGRSRVVGEERGLIYFFRTREKIYIPSHLGLVEMMGLWAAPAVTRLCRCGGAGRL